MHRVVARLDQFRFALFQYRHHLVESLRHLDDVARAGRRGAHAGLAAFSATHQAGQRVQRPDHAARKKTQQQQQYGRNRKRDRQVAEQQVGHHVFHGALAKHDPHGAQHLRRVPGRIEWRLVRLADGHRRSEDPLVVSLALEHRMIHRCMRITWKLGP